MALEGTLRDFSFADILQLISLQRKTGVLTLKHEANLVTISFLDGHIVGANSLSQHTEDRLGLILLKRGLLTETELEAALRRQEETLQRLGRILIDYHLASAEDVRHALEQQMLQIVYRVFRWADGDYHFSQETGIDYDKELVNPIATDSIIMEGARMTDEWPFIDQRIPDREIVFIKVDPARRLMVVEQDQEGFDDLGFSFVDSPEEAPKQKAHGGSGDRVTPIQQMVYRMVDGRESVNELIQGSPFIEFETCKALADLLDRSLVRKASPEEVARQLRRTEAPDKAKEKEKEARTLPAAIPWLAAPFLVLLGFSFTIMGVNPANPCFGLKHDIWDRYVEESRSWFAMDRLSDAVETTYYLDGLYPETLADVRGTLATNNASLDPWGRQYRLVTRGSKLMVTGSDDEGQPVPLLLLSRSFAWEGAVLGGQAIAGPGVLLLPEE